MSSKISNFLQLIFFAGWNFLILEVIHFLIAGKVILPWMGGGCKPPSCSLNEPCPDICLPQEPRLVAFFFLFFLSSVLFAFIQSALIKKSFAPRFVMVLVSLIVMLCAYMGFTFIPVIIQN